MGEARGDRGETIGVEGRHEGRLGRVAPGVEGFRDAIPRPVNDQGLVHGVQRLEDPRSHHLRVAGVGQHSRKPAQLGPQRVDRLATQQPPKGPQRAP